MIATIRYEDEGEHAYFYNKDIRTSVTNVIDESGSGVVSYRYDDYGTTTKYGNQDFYNELCYTSGVYDELTGLYYLNARYYNPDTATFITQDSYRGEQGDYGTWNLYAYCGGNPIAYVDPSGHIASPIVRGRYYSADAWDSLRKFEKKKITKKRKIIKSPYYKRHKKTLKNIKINKKEFKTDLKQFKKIYKKNKRIYEKIGKKTKLPPQLVAAIHYRESGCDFDAYYHNGDPLGEPTTHVPIGKFFTNFYDSAVDALSAKEKYRKEFRLSYNSKNIAAMLSFAEIYNGVGYLRIIMLIHIFIVGRMFISLGNIQLTEFMILR